MKKNLTQLSYRLLLLFSLVFILSAVSAGTINLPAVSSSIIFTNPVQNNNMFLGIENTASQEGYTLPATILGSQCREIPAGKFMYTYSSRTAVPTSATNIIISITYYDSSMNSIWINYTRNGNAGGWGTADFQKSNTKKWITRIITITDAGLDGSMGYGGDIRMGFGGENNYIKDISISVGTLNPSAEPVPAKVNAPGAEFIGKSFAGYQLWHQAGSTPQDWLHWSYGMLPAAGRGNHNTETFPHISDYNGNPNVTMYPTNFANLGDGSPTKLYNSTDKGVIDVQMSLLKNAGFDGVAIQRNAPIGRALKASPDDYYVSIKNACENNGRLFYVMYCMPDTNNGSAHLEDVVAGIERDWVYQMEQVYALTSSSAYATVNGKPVVELWGLGYSTIEINNPQALALAAFFKARGCYVIAGTPRDWRLMNEGSRTDFSNIYKSYDMISPWTVGAYNDTTSANNYKINYEAADKAYCDANGMGYYPVVFVGSAWSEPVSGYPNDTKRVGGKFLWKQAQNATNIGVKSMYFAMLDEFEESTDIINAATDYFDIPTDQYFGTLAMDGIWCSPDYYLRLGGAAARMLQSGISQPTITTPYSLGPIYYRNSFESRVANCIISNVPQNIISPIDACFYNAAVITNTAVTSPSVAIVNPATTFTKSGVYSTQITGNATGAGKYYYQVSETKIAVKANMALSFWKYSVNTLGQNTSVDLIFKSGKTLHSLAAYTDNNGNAMTPTVARGTIGTWQKFNCQIGKGVLIGDEIDGIAIAYDNPSASGNFNAYFDDIIIQDAVDTTTATSIFITYSNPQTSNNLTQYTVTDPANEPYTVQTTQGGLDCIQVPSSKYAYYNVNDAAITSTQNNLIFTITYFDQGTDNIAFQYNATGGSNYTGMNIQKTGTNTWITATIAVTDASLRNAQNNGCDFRIGTTTGFNNYIRNITITTGTLNPAGEPVPVTTGSAYSEFKGKSIAGYQAWFSTGNPTSGWFHWAGGAAPAVNHLNFEVYPDTREYNAADLTNTAFANLGNGQTSALFNSANDSVIAKHFSWMKTAGIDGVAVQRFINGIGSVINNSPAATPLKIKKAAEANNKIFYICYDISSTGLDSTWEDIIKFDWVYNIEKNYALTGSSAYATVNGKPVVEIWGTGFTGDHPGTEAETIDLINFLKARGCYVIGGVPTYWRTENNDSKPAFMNAYKAFNMISPWSVGRFGDSAGAVNFKNSLIVPDKTYTDGLGLDYLPVIFPGFSWSQWNNATANAPNAIPRKAGSFWWQQALDIKSAGLNAMYFAMFDEYDEGTAIMKAATDYTMIPTDQYFVTTSADGIYTSSDFYLRLAAAGTQLLKGTLPVSATVPIPYSQGPVYYRNSFEKRYTVYNATGTPGSGTGYFNIDPCFYNDGVVTTTNVTAGTATINNVGSPTAKTGLFVTQITGNANSATGANNYYYKISQTKIAVKANMALSFWKNSINALGQYTSVDLTFKSGKTLRSLSEYTDNNGNAMQPTTARGIVGTWQKFNCQIGKGQLIGDTIVGITIAYDHPSATGTFTANFDDIIIQDALDTTTATTIPSYSMITANPQQFTKVEFAINVAAPFTNAYDATQIALDMVATSPSGLTIVQPCFYNSGNSAASSWSARFTPKEVGNYSYFFRLTQSATTITNSNISTFTVTATTKDGFLHTVAGNNWIFKFDDGKPFKGIGEDYAWQPRNYENQKYVYSYMIPRLAANGANFFRTWMCPWNLPLEWKNPINTNFYTSSTQYFNPSAIAGIDSLVNLSEANGMYMMITLNTFGDLIDQWSINSYNTANGGPCATPNDFFASAAAKTMFKNRLRYIIARWGYSSSVAALELFNEIDNAVYGTSPNLTQADVTQWHKDMSAYIKSIDPYGHMVTTSVSYRDITGLNAVPSFDFNQQHIYSDPAIGDVITKIPATIRSYDASTGKPYSIGEYGYDWRGPDAAQGLQNDSNYRRGLWYGIFSPTPIAPMSWWWELFDDRGTPAYLHNIQDISNKMITAGGGVMTDLTVSGSNLPEKYGAKCGTSYFVYARCAPTGTINTNLTIPVTGTTYDVNIYNTTTGAYTDNGISTASSGVLTLPVVTLGNGADVIMIATPATTPPPTTGGLNYPALLGYWQNWDDPASPFIPLDQVDPKYNNVIVAFATPINGNQYQIGFTPYNTTQATFITQIQTLQGQGRKVLISIGGEGAPVSITNTTQEATFVSTVETILNTYGFDGVDIDFEGTSLSISGGTISAPVDATEIYLVAALKQIMQDYRAAHNKKMLLTMAPETADVQGGMSAYGRIWGSYLPVINGLKDSLDVLQVQLYNTGSMYGIDGNVYNEGTADFIVAETEAAIKGFSTAGGLYVGLPANKVAVGLPSCVGAAGGGFTDTATVHAAMNYLLGKGPKPGSYTLQQSGGYPTLEGMMDWSINYDKICSNNSYATNFQNIFSTTSPTETPYGGTPWPIPGTIQAENYDNGGQALAYNDNEPANQGGQYRTTEGVDVETCSDAGGGYDVGYTNNGEWMRYMVNVTATGVYTLQTRVASNSAGNSLHVEIDGVTISGSIAVPNTGGFQTWQTVTVTTPTLTAGPHIMRIYMETGGFNLNYVTFVATSTVPVITSANTASGTVGVGFTTYTIAATNTPTSYAVTGTLPAGLTFAAGVISGTPTVAGTFVDTVKAINASGTGVQVLTITIAAAPTGCSTSTIVNATVVPTIDGTVDAVWNNAPKNNIAQTISGTIQTGSTWQAMYDATNLYVLVQVKDANLSSTGTNVYDQDGVELFLSGNNSKAGAYNTTYDHQYRFNWNVAPSVANISGNTNSKTGINYAIPTSAGGYTLEAAIPWTTIGGAAPYNGEPIGFDIDLNDQQDNSGAREATAGWYLTNNDDYQNTAGFGTVNLSICAATVPLVTSAITANGTINTAFTYNITATNTPTSYSVGGTLPAGVTINTSTGIISGTPTVSGTFIDTVKATNAGGTGTQIVTITINPAKPVVATASTTGTVGTTFSYTISATNSPTSYASTTLPAGLVLNTSTGVISGTPTTAGTFTVTDTAKNISGAGNGTLTITINPSIPVITTGLATGTVGTVFSYTISATNASSFSSTLLPAGLTLNSATGVISGTPTTAGTFAITDTAKNISGTATGSLTIVINPVKPVVATASTTGTVGTVFSYTISATNNPTSYGSTTLPAGLTLNTSTGVISGTPTIAGTFTITDTAKNISGAGNGTLTITINPAKPVVATASTTGTVGTVFSYTISATNNPTSYGSTTLPAGLTLNTSTGVISGTPTTAGTFTITDTAKNISGAGNGTLTITINPAKPVVATTSTTGTVGTTFSYTISATNNPTSYGSTTLPVGLTLNTSTGVISGTPTTAGTFTVTDTAKNISGAGNGTLTITINPAKPVISSASVNGTTGVAFSYTIAATNNPTSYSASALPAGLSFNTITGTISGTPTAPGTFIINDTAVNISGSGTGAVTITITTILPPVPVVTNGSITGTVGAAFSYSIIATNSPTGYSSTILPAGLSLNSAGVISGIPTTAGTFIITDTAKNAGGNGTGTVTITINPAKPVVATASTTGTVGTAFSYTISATNNPTSYASTVLPAGLTLNTSTGAISGTPTTAGTFTVTDTAKNISGAGNGTLTITINPAKPVVATASTTGTVGTAFSYTISATNSPTSYASTVLPAGLTLNTSTGVISGTPTAAGTFIVTDTAKNISGAGNGTLTITINPAKPVVATASTTGTVGTVFSYTISATNNPTSYASTVLPASLTLNTSTGVISGTPTTAGTFTVTDTAKNISGAGNGTLTITINPAKPVISSASVNGTTGVAFSYTIAATNNPTSYSASALPAGLSFNTITGTISGTPTAPGTFIINDTAVNISGSGTGTVTITVTTILPPVPVVTNGSITGTVGVALSYSIIATNSPTGYSSTILPAGLSLNSAGIISGAPTTAGTFIITDTAKNAGGNGTGTLTITINPAKPVVATASTTGTVGTAFSYAISATNNPTSYASTTLPAGLTLNTSTGVISGTPTTAGTFTITDTAKNISGAGKGTLTITINPPLPVTPVISSASSATGTVGAVFSYTIIASNNPTSYAVTNLPTGLMINTTTSVISGIPTIAGTFIDTIKATNAAGTGTKVLTITIVLNPPVITSSIVAGGTVGAAFSYTITATNNPTSYGATTLPAGLTVNTSTGIISGTPTASGTFTTTITATNAAGSGTELITITVNALPGIPVIGGNGAVSGIVDVPFEYDIVATNVVSYNATNLPAGLSVNTATGKITGTPIAAGVYYVTISAINTNGTQNNILEITITAPLPVITSDTITTTIEGQPFSYTIQADNGPVSYSATGLPQGLTINAATGEIRGTATSLGDYPVTITATNSGGSTTEVLHINVTTVTPVLMPNPVTDGHFTLTLPNWTEGQTVNVNIMNLAGKEIQRGTAVINNGMIYVMVPNLIAGNYVAVVIGDNNKKVVKKFTVK